MSYRDQPEGAWEKLSHIAVKGAEYDSPERQPHPKCLQGTRVNLLEYIYALLDDLEKNQLIWLHGTAGVGKSAVAFTVAEHIDGLEIKEEITGEKRLAGTFFFSRKYAQRCMTGYFFATLVYQLASNFPSIRDDLDTAIRENPALLDPKKPLRIQMEALFLRPLRRLQLRLLGCPPLIFVIDALDECTSEAEIADLISLLGKALREPGLPVVHILLTSRSEAHIHEAIHQEEVRPLVCEIPVKISGEGVASLISLDGADVDSDIYIVLKHSFIKLRSRYPDFPQPTQRDLERLASRAGRRFIVASTMMKFIDDGYSDPYDRLQLMLELTSKLLPGTEVYKLYDLILSTCTDFRRAHLHLSVVAALAHPLPISQISELLGPGEGRDVETLLTQLRSIMNIPADSTHPVDIYHSSVRDYALERSNCSFLEEQYIPRPPHSLLAYSSFRLMIRKISESTGLLDTLLETKSQSQSVGLHDPQNPSVLAEPSTALGVLITLVWLRGDCEPLLYSWLETRDGRAWLCTRGGNSWLESHGGLQWLQTRAGLIWLQTQAGKDWLQVPGVQNWLQCSGGRDWLQTRSGRGWLRTQKAQEWLQTWAGQEWLQVQDMHELLQTGDGLACLETRSGREWLKTESGQEWLKTRSGKRWLYLLQDNSEDDDEWFQALCDQESANVNSEREPSTWLQTHDTPWWLETQSGRTWLRTQIGLTWLQTQSGREWLKTQVVKERLQTQVKLEPLQFQSTQRRRLVNSEYVWLQTVDGEEWLQIEDGQEWLKTEIGKEWLNTLMVQERLRTQRGQEWLKTQHGRELLQTEAEREWLQSKCEQEWLQTQGGQEWLQTKSAQEWLQTTNVQTWLQTQVAQEWLQTESGRWWLSTQSGRRWLQTQDGREWIQTQRGQEWLQTWSGSGWQKTQDGKEWLQTRNGREWLQVHRKQEWLKTRSGRGWLQTKIGREWLQTQDGKDWLRMPHGQAWQSTPAASFQTHIEDLLDTVEAVTEFTITPELSSSPALQIIHRFKNSPDFWTFPTLLTLTPNDATAALSARGPDIEIIHVINTFMAFTDEVRKQNCLGSGSLTYACQHWAMHLSRALNQRDDALNHVFKVFWERHLLSWLERQWCLRGLRSCLIVLSEGQKLAKEFDLHLKSANESLVERIGALTL